MEQYNVLEDVAKRTQGDIYIGVVGPVRTGKSTFIKNFMDQLVIPNISNEFKKERAKDELPQSAKGKTIMTTEPKFIPNEAIKIKTEDNVNFNVRMIDCVGYVVDSALGHIENEEPRMVNTPWYPEPIPFIKAAELGTKKVICDHSTIGLVITTDGSVSEIEREDYVEAEERVIGELKQIGKPFVVLLNCVNPTSPESIMLKEELSRKYSVPVMAINCLNITKNELLDIIGAVLNEFPVKEVWFDTPDWLSSLAPTNWLKSEICRSIKEVIKDAYKVNDIRNIIDLLKNYDFVKYTGISDCNLGEGTVLIKLDLKDELFYKILSENTELSIENDKDLLTVLTDLSKMKKEYDKFSYAMADVNRKGYGIVSPSIDELTLEEPEIVKQGNKFGVRLKASAPSIHMIKADIETEVSPIVGTEKQSEELVHYLLKEFEADPKSIWSSNIFGKSLHELVNEGLHNKLSKMPEDAQVKMQETLQKIINEGSGGLICIIL
ncbi:MAG: stage IV sporulation protein A [Ruminococcaceae bacterium]|nr:stage IV sporulation protein A [Oscillospiraceae bacterium]